MDLKIKDISELLNVPEKTILEWIKQNKIPVYKINQQYRFNKSEINDWILKNKISVSNKILDFNITNKPVVLSYLFERGGFFYNIKGSNPSEVLKNAVEVINIPKSLNKEDVLYSLLERENMMPTAMGRGVAFPHPRNPIISEPDLENISVCFTEKEIDYAALDGLKVHTIFILISSTPQRHLQILARLSFLCQQEKFISLIKSKSDKNTILSYIKNLETEWNRKTE